MERPFAGPPESPRDRKSGAQGIRPKDYFGTKTIVRRHPSLVGDCSTVPSSATS